MSFKKQFRATPVILGEYARAQQARRRRKTILNSGIILVTVTLIVFIVGMAITNPAFITTYLPSNHSLLQSAEERQRVEHSAYYSNCKAARLAGVAPIYRGTPGYRSEMDEDGDGTACEPFIGR